MKAIATERHEAVPLGSISPNPRQPRKVFEQQSIEELAGTIRLHGLQQPVVLEQVDEDADRFILIAGERRWRAYQWLAEQPATPDFDPADFERIPSVIRQIRSSAPDRTRAILALIENVVREDLSPRDRAAAFTDLKGKADGRGTRSPAISAWIQPG
jgi:ParB family chromosome partitioning protein